MTASRNAVVVRPALVCPADRLPLDDLGDALACANGHRYATRLGIPRIVVSESGYADAFGEQWNRYRLTQLDSYTGTTISEERLRRCLGEPLWSRLDGAEPLTILETGCGAGRFTEVLLGRRAAYVDSTDLSVAVEANQSNCPQTDRHRINQCDIWALPFAPASYDVVVCLGVIQHTPHPETTIAKLYEQVKPGGWLVFDHYTPSFSLYTKFTANLLRPVLKRLSPERGTAATELLTKLFFPLHRAVRHVPLGQRILSRISPLLTFYHMYPELDHQLPYEWALLDTHDSLTDYYKHLRTGPQIHAALVGLRAGNIWVARGGNGIEARCRKPANT